MCRVHHQKLICTFVPLAERTPSRRRKVWENVKMAAEALISALDSRILFKP